MSFSHFRELWLAGSHGGGITSGRSYIHIAPGKNAYIQIKPGEKFAARLGGQSEYAVARGAVGIGGGGVALCCMWGLRLASLLTHLFKYFLTCMK